MGCARRPRPLSSGKTGTNAGQNVETRITVRNAGMRRPDNVKLSAEYPLNWRVEIPLVIVPSIEINREEMGSLKIITPADAGVGDYEVRIKTESFADNRRIQSEDKDSSPRN